MALKISDIEALKVEFEKFYPIMEQEILTDPMFNDIPDAIEWLKVLMENVPDGKEYRGMLAVLMYRMLNKNMTKEDEKLIFIIAWNIEILQASAFMMDDFIRNIEKRNGKETWFKAVGLQQSFIDSFVLENIISYFYYKYLSGQDYFCKFMKELHLNMLQTLFGQCWDLKGLNISSLTMESGFTREKYKTLVKYKAGYYAFHYPILCAMIMSGIKDENLYTQVTEITLKLGHLFQVQEDFLNCYYVDPENKLDAGKTGQHPMSDIRRKKCTWLIVRALEIASPEQKKLLLKLYGSKVPEAESTVKCMYQELEMEEEYRKYERELFDELKILIRKLPKNFPKEPFRIINNMMYKRKEPIL